MTAYINATLRLVINEEALARHAPASPLQMGSEIGHQIQEHEHKLSLGYYPSIDYFRQTDDDTPCIDENLLETFDSILWLGEELVRSEFRTKLRSVFSKHRIVDIRHHAQSLPKVRPDDRDSAHKLAAHFTPTRLKVDFQGIPTPRLKDGNVQSAALFALRDSFENTEFAYFESIES